MSNKSKAQSPKDYEILPSPTKALVPSSPQRLVPLTPNRFSPLNNKPEVPYKSVLAAPQPKPSNIHIPNSPDQIAKYVCKDWIEDMGITPYLSLPGQILQKDFVRNRFPSLSYLWDADDPRKNQKYYELVLIDSKSIEVTHNSSSDSKEVSFSKCVIRKIHSESSFGGLREFKSFSVTHPAKGYHFTDYKNAWIRTFFIRPFNHSWFFTFHSNIDTDFPIWFYDWWKKFGSLIHITPPSVQKGFETYSNLSIVPNHLKPLVFHAVFKVPWIFAWDFHFSKIYPDPTPLSLVRVFKVKWWSKFSDHICSEQAVRHFMSTGQKVTYQGSASKEPSPSKTPGKAKAAKPDFSSMPDFSDMPEAMKNEFFEFLAKKSCSSKSKSEESVNSDPIGGQDPYDAYDSFYDD